jgi:hypothetical protein
MHPSYTHSDLSAYTNDDPDPVMAERRALALNVQRQKQMVADSDKLLKLAMELNQEVAKANNGALNGDEMHKIAEIEKLAHNVKERMVNGIGQPAGPMAQPMIAFPPPSFGSNH